MQLIEEYTSVGFITFMTWPVPCFPQKGTAVRVFLGAWPLDGQASRHVLPASGKSSHLHVSERRYQWAMIRDFNQYPLKKRWDTHDSYQVGCSMIYIA